jgi:hypothetical protein
MTLSDYTAKTKLLTLTRIKNMKPDLMRAFQSRKKSNPISRLSSETSW